MKKLVSLFAFVSILLTSCVTYQTLNLNRLTTGMSKAEVEMVAGYPNRVLAVSDTRDGYMEVLEYRTSGGDYYALEFWNDYLVGYEYLESDVAYVPAPAPPAYYPPYGRAVVAIPARVRPVAPNPPVVIQNNYYNNQTTSRPSTSRPSTSQSAANRPVERVQSSGSANRVTSSSSSSGTGNRTSTTTQRSTTTTQSNRNATTTQRSTSTAPAQTNRSSSTTTNTTNRSSSSVSSDSNRSSTNRSSTTSSSSGTSRSSSSSSSSSSRSSGSRTR